MLSFFLWLQCLPQGNSFRTFFLIIYLAKSFLPENSIMHFFLLPRSSPPTLKLNYYLYSEAGRPRPASLREALTFSCS
jgi:hypothetical protein